MTTRYVPDRAGLHRLEAGPDIEHEMRVRAELARDEVERFTPRDDDAPHAADQITVDSGEEDGTSIARVISEKFTASWLEFGTVRMPAFAPLRRGFEAVGLEVRDER